MMDYTLIFTVIGSAATIVGLCYAIIRNFKSDMDKKFELIERKFELMEKKFDLVFAEIRQLRQELQELKGDMREMKGEMKWLYRHEEKVK